jgi:RimJ/RimL family protein N-acetyltransferase
MHDDKSEIASLFSRLSNETRFLRYHYYKAAESQDEIESLCNVDYYDTFALVAEMNRNKRDEIVGIAHYYRLSQPDTAEVSFVVEDKEQGNGIGTNLLKILSLMAAERGISTFVAELLNENVVMLNIFRKYNPNLDQVVDGNTKYVAFSIRTT